MPSSPPLIGVALNGAASAIPPSALHQNMPSPLPGPIPASASGSASATAGAQEPPHDVTGLTEYQWPWGDYILLGLLVVLLGLALPKVLARMRKKPEPKEEELPAAPPDPVAEILSELGVLEPGQPFDTKAREDYFYALSMLLRRMIELQIGIKATDLFTYEIAKKLRDRPGKLAVDEVSSLIQFLEKADGIKFAHHEIGISEAERDKADVERLIRAILGRMLR